MVLMYLSAIVLGVVIGWLRRGSLFNLEQLPLRYLGLVALAIAMRFLVSRGAAWPGLLGGYAPWLLAGAFLLLLASVLVYGRRPGMGLLAAGAILNIVVIFANGGRMPVSPAALAAVAGEEAVRDLAQGREPGYVLVTAETRLPFLGDVLHLPPALGLSQFFSIGDILIWLAILHLVQVGMQGQRPRSL